MLTVLRVYGSTVAVIDRFVFALCGVLLAAIVALNGVEILTRYFLNSSSIYNAEGSLVLSALMYFAGYAVLLRRDEDITLDYFYAKFPERGRLVIDFLIACGALVFFAVLFETSLRYFRLTSVMMHPVLPVSQSWTVAPILVGAAVCLYVAFYRVLHALARLAGLAPDAVHSRREREGA